MADQPNSSKSNDLVSKTQSEINEVVDIMKQNVDKVLERDTKLSEVEQRAEGLFASSHDFERQSVQYRRKQQAANLRMKLYMGGVAVGVSLLIIYVLFY